MAYMIPKTIPKRARDDNTFSKKARRLGSLLADDDIELSAETEVLCL